MADAAALRHKYALAEIKKLYYKQQYKQCISGCELFLQTESQNVSRDSSLLSPMPFLLCLQVHPIQRATILFFAGLAHDSQARNMSFRSPFLLRALDQAEQAFCEAMANLLSLSTPSEEVRIQSIIEEEEESPRRNRLHLGRSSRGSQESSPSLTSSGTTVSDDSYNEEGMRQSYPANRSIKDDLSPSALTFGSRDGDGLESTNHAQRYNQLLTTLNLLISKHLASVESYRQFVTAAHDREQRFGALLSSKDMTEEEKSARIARGRANGWRRARFNSQRYQELCDRALGEL